MKLSIITVNLNNRDGLKRTIESVVSQTFTDYEWIVIDGGSTDGSRELIEQYADRFAYWCSEPDKGIYNAMNKGIFHANGQWMQFLNSGDSLFERNTLEKVFTKEYYEDVVYGDVNYVDAKGRLVRTEKKPDNLRLSYFYHNTLCHQATFYKKDIFIKYKYDESLSICADMALNISLLLNNYQLKHIPLYIVNFEEGGIGAVFTPKHIEERESMYAKYIPEYLQVDMRELREYEKERVYINSHKIYSLIYRLSNLKIKIASKLVIFIEKIKIQIKRQTPLR